MGGSPESGDVSGEIEPEKMVTSPVGAKRAMKPTKGLALREHKA